MAKRKNELDSRVYSSTVATLKLPDTTMVCPICGRSVRIGKVRVDVAMDLNDMKGQPHHLIGRTIDPNAIMRDYEFFARDYYAPSLYDFLGQRLIDIYCGESEMRESHLNVPMIGIPTTMMPAFQILTENKMWVSAIELIDPTLQSDVFARIRFVNPFTDEKARIAIFDSTAPNGDGDKLFGKVEWHNTKSLNILNSSTINIHQSPYENKVNMPYVFDRLVECLSLDEAFVKANEASSTLLDALLHEMYSFTPNIKTNQTGLFVNYTTDPVELEQL